MSFLFLPDVLFSEFQSRVLFSHDIHVKRLFHSDRNTVLGKQSRLSTSVSKNCLTFFTFLQENNTWCQNTSAGNFN